MMDTGLTVHLAVMEDGEAILIDRIEAPGTPHLATWIGKRMGLHCTALGKALICGTPHERTGRIDPQAGADPAQRKHDRIAAGASARLREVQQLGYAVDDEEEEIGVRCIGAPVRNGTGEVVAAISISGTKAKLENIPAKAAQ